MRGLGFSSSAPHRSDVRKEGLGKGGQGLSAKGWEKSCDQNSPLPSHPPATSWPPHFLLAFQGPGVVSPRSAHTPLSVGPGLPKCLSSFPQQDGPDAASQDPGG